MIDPNSSTPPAPLTPAPTVTPQPHHPKASISANEAETMAGWIKADLASGKMTQAQADAAFAELNTPMDQRAPDSRSDEEKMLDEHFPSAKPEDYTIRYGVPGQEPTMTPELRQFDANSRTWLAGAGFPRETGNSLVSTITQVLQETARMTPDQLETYRQTQLMILQRAHGEKLKERLRAADDMIDHVEQVRPGLIKFLGAKGVGKNAMVWNMLIAHAPIYHARKGR